MLGKSSRVPDQPELCQIYLARASPEKVQIVWVLAYMIHQNFFIKMTFSCENKIYDPPKLFHQDDFFM